MLLSTSLLRGQSARPLQNIPTPEASGLGIYGNTPVGLFTGVPNISVPLHEMKVGPYSFPISVSYHLASVRPNTQEGHLGLGWSLLTGGCINRTVRGVYDEKLHSDGHAPGYYANYAKMKNITPEQFAVKTQDIQKPTGYYELSADEFSFNFGGYSGNFYLNENGQWDVVSDHDIRVEFNESDGFLSLSQLRSNILTNGWGARSQNQRFFNKFTLVTPDGCRYEFGGVNATEYSIPYYARYNSDLTATTWYLTRVTMPEGWKVDYVYEPSGPTCTLNYAPSQRILYGMETTPQPIVAGRNALTGFLHFPVMLKEIQTPNETATLKYAPAHLEPTHIGDYFLQWNSGENNGNSSNAIDEVFAQYENPANQFHLFLEGSQSESARNKFRYHNLHAIEIKSNLSLYNCKTYYFEYVFNTRKKLSLITERTGAYIEDTYWQTGGGVAYIKYRIPPVPTDYTPKEYRFRYNTTQYPLAA